MKNYKKERRKIALAIHCCSDDALLLLTHTLQTSNYFLWTYNEIFYDENELKRNTQNVDCKLLKWFLTSMKITFYLENKNEIALADSDCYNQIFIII